MLKIVGIELAKPSKTIILSAIILENADSEMIIRSGFNQVAKPSELLGKQATIENGKLIILNQAKPLGRPKKHQTETAKLAAKSLANKRYREKNKTK